MGTFQKRYEEPDVQLPYKGKLVSLPDAPVEYYAGEPLDEEIEEVVLELNSRGICTFGSCAGHIGRVDSREHDKAGRPIRRRGFIALSTPYSSKVDKETRKEVKEELRGIGAKHIRFTDDGDNTYATFDSLVD